MRLKDLTRSSVLRWLALFALGCFLCAVVCLATAIMAPQKIKSEFAGGASAEIRLASVLNSFETKTGLPSFILIKSVNGKTADVALFQGPFDHPTMVLPTTNENTFICIYDFDVGYRLLRIDLSRKFVAPKPGDFPAGTILPSTCAVEAVDKTDATEWELVAATVQKMPARQFNNSIAGLDLCLFRLHQSQKTLAKMLNNWGDFPSN